MGYCLKLVDGHWVEDLEDPPNYFKFTNELKDWLHENRIMLKHGLPESIRGILAKDEMLRWAFRKIYGVGKYTDRDNDPCIVFKYEDHAVLYKMTWY